MKKSIKKQKADEFFSSETNLRIDDVVIEADQKDIEKSEGYIDNSLLPKSLVENITSDGKKEYITRLPDINKEVNSMVNKRFVSTCYPYKAHDSLLTDAELTLRKLLDKGLALKEKIIVLEKVRLADILDVDTDYLEDSSNENKYKFAIAYKHVDFIIVDNEFHTPICAIELGDFTHKREDRMKSDQLKFGAFRAAGIPLIWINKKIKDVTTDDLKEINEEIYNFYAPACPICGAKTIIKEQKRGSRVGHLFYSCLNFSRDKCTGTIDIEDVLEKLRQGENNNDRI